MMQLAYMKSLTAALVESITLDRLASPDRKMKLERCVEMACLVARCNGVLVKRARVGQALQGSHHPLRLPNPD
jgi:hypothetical protein